MHRSLLHGIATLVYLSFLLAPPTRGQDVLLTMNTPSGEVDFGRATAPIGDFDGDGKSDILVSSTAVGNPPLQILRVHDDSGAVLAAHSLSPGEYTSHVVGLDDIDGDGTPDYAFAASPAPYSGGLGAPVATTGDVVVVSGLTGAELRRHAGTDVARAGDVDGDGVRDVLTAEPAASTTGLQNNGAVCVHSGADGSLIHRIDGPYSTLRIGTAIAGLGDVTGDAVADYAFGMNPVAAIPGSTHTAYVVSGATGAIVTSHTIPSVPSATLPVGRFLLKGEGDVDADGVGDIVMALSTDGVAGSNTGLIRVVSGADGTVIHDLVGAPCEGLGDSVALVDINADGHADIVQGNFVDIHTLDNEASVYSGLTGEIMLDSDSATGSIDVQHTDRAGDLDGDGYDDVMFLHWSSGSIAVQRIVVIAGGPALGSTADSMVGAAGGQRQDVLKVNGETGGSVHCVGCGIGAPLTLSIDQPSTNATPAHFAVFGRIGVPMGDETHAVPGVNGAMAVPPAPLVPWAIPSYFTLVSSVGPMPGGQVLLSGPAPWSVTIPGGLGFPVELTLEGVIMEGPSIASKTNAVIIRIR